MTREGGLGVEEDTPGRDTTPGRGTTREGTMTPTGTSAGAPIETATIAGVDPTQGEGDETQTLLIH